MKTTEYRSHQKTRALTALPVMAVLLLAALAIPSLGLVGVAEAKKEGKDKRDKLVSADLDIKSYGFDHKNAYIEVVGTAGGTLANDDDKAIAYVLFIVTRSGEEQTWAIDSHAAQHTTSHDPSTMWHAHRVHLTDNRATPEVDATCLNEVDEVTHATMKGHRVIFEDMKAKTKHGVEGIEAKEITMAATVRLNVLVEDPDNPGNVPCIASVDLVFDLADHGKKKRD